MKKFFKFLSVTLGIIMLCAFFTACDFNTAKAEDLSYVSMRINPEIELVVDKEGKVVAVNAINEDGETVICQLQLVGMTVEEAGEAFTSMAIELGFIDVNAENATVYILTEGENEETLKEIKEKVEKKINDLFDKKGIFGKVSEELLEEYKELATQWNVPLKDVKIIKRILELYPEMTIEEILALDFKEKIELIKDDCIKNGLPANLRDKYEEAVSKIKEEYSDLFTLEKEIKDIKIKLESTELSEDEKAQLQAEYDAKKSEYDALKEQFDQAIKQLKEEEKQKAEDIKEEIKKEANERRENFADKIKEHEEKFQKEKDIIKEKIKSWRDSHKHFSK